MSFNIGPHRINTKALLAPMAGVTDLAFRKTARKQGAKLCYSEMLTADSRLWASNKSQHRLPNEQDPFPRPIQIAGSDPHQMAEAAKICQDQGAGIIDINMGCPAKKVCSKAAGSALLADEKLVSQILEAVVTAVDIPVTLKTRLGVAPNSQNIVTIAKRAESTGIQAITIHGRTKACKFNGTASYNLIAEVSDLLKIPVIANGDIDTPEKAAYVLGLTKAAAVMIGRGAWGNPWLLAQIDQFMESGKYDFPNINDIHSCLKNHLHLLYEYQGDYMGVRLARKQVIHYLRNLQNNHALALNIVQSFSQLFNQLEYPQQQLQEIDLFFDQVTRNNKVAA